MNCKARRRIQVKIFLNGKVETNRQTMKKKHEQMCECIFQINKKKKNGSINKENSQRQSNNQSDPNKQLMVRFLFGISWKIVYCIFFSLFYYYYLFWIFQFWCGMCKNMRYVFMTGMHRFFILIIKMKATTNHETICRHRVHCRLSLTSPHSNVLFK